MDEMRKVAQLNRDYLAMAIVIILLVVGLVFIVQLVRLRQTESALSVSLSSAATGAEPRGAGWAEPGADYPQGGDPGRPQLPFPNPEGDEPNDKWEEEAERRLSQERWTLQPQLPPSVEIANGSWFLSAAAPQDGELCLDAQLPPLDTGARPSFLHPDTDPPLSRGTLIIRFLPRLALIIDDWGYDWDMAKEFLKLDIPFTAAVLPYRTETENQLTLLRQTGHEVILHLPMEPKNPAIELDDQCIKTDLSDAEIRSRVEAALAAVRPVAGVNNHMGSKATSDERVVRAVLEVIRENKLYFVDSWTAPTSVARALAAEMEIPSATNQAFLDHYDDVEKVKRQIERLIRLAKRDGQALGIGHVRPQTYRALTEMITRFAEEGILIVPASQVVSVP
ncbi:MAG: divergent polysaccharide deacetylase family protein [Firmicutes bacterium]|nr:divergent polysaccharide deacetylase family protein [Bacillota bacterium]